MPESTNSDKNVIANNAGLDKNNHNEQSDQSTLFAILKWHFISVQL